MKEDFQGINKFFYILFGAFFCYLFFGFIILESFKEDNECGELYKEVREYKYIAGKIIHVQNNDTIYRLGFKLDKYKNKCLTCMNGDSIVYVKFRIASNRYDIVKGDSLYSDTLNTMIYRNGQLRPKLGLY